MQFIDYFLEQLQHRPYMPFVEFMHYALYAPFVGYYSAGQMPLGKQGDFITAPELTPLFGYTLANQCQQIFKTLDKPILFEFGAGTGKLCIDLMRRLQALNALPEAYFILDVSASLKASQQTLIRTEIPELYERIQWLTHWPSAPFEGVIIANEVLDAMPVHRFLKKENTFYESMVKLNAETQQFEECFIVCKNQDLIHHIDQNLNHNVVPYLSEANLFMNDWFMQCASMLDRGVLFIIDYGFPSHEYYHPDRTQGTLMCHARHTTHPDPLHNPGLEDITAHVDFTHVAHAACDAGFHVAGYTNQASFLLANDLLSFLNSDDLKCTQAVKQLTHPSEMGELFKVIALTKQFEDPLQGFQLNDKRASL